MDKQYKTYAGAGKAVIAFTDDLLGMEGFMPGEDDVHVRALYVKSAQEWLVVSFEMTSIREYEITTLKDLLCKQTAIDQEHIWLCVTHNFSVPHTRSQNAIQKDATLREKNIRYCEAIETAALQAATQALYTQEEAVLHYSFGHCELNVQRDIYTKNGWWIGKDPDGFHDTVLPLIAFRSKEGSLIGVLYSYDMQSSVMDGVQEENGTRLICTDITGYTSLMIEKELDTVALYVLGAAGDQAPRHKVHETIVSEEGNMIHLTHKGMAKSYIVQQGSELANQVLKALSEAKTMLPAELRCETMTLHYKGQKIAEDIRSLSPCKEYAFQTDKQEDIPIEIITAGEVAIIGIQPELCSRTASEIRKASPYPFTMIVTMVNGGAKYMPDQTAYERITYEAMNSKFAKGSAEALCEQILDELCRRRRKQG